MKRFVSLLMPFLMIAGLLVLTCTSKKEAAKTTTGFSIRTGVNVSHWLSQSDKRGEARKNYIVKCDFDTIASVGFDHVRIPVDEEQLWNLDGDKETEAFELLHNAIKLALAAKLRVIVDLHIVRSHDFLSESKPLWTEVAEQEKFVDMWRQLSEELRQYPVDMVAYEIMNQAVADDPDDWNNLIEKVITEIRIKEPERKIVLGSNEYNAASAFPDLKVPEDDRNLILTFHFYDPLALTFHKAPWVPAVAEYTGEVNYPGQIVDTLHYKELSKAAVEAMRKYANGYFTKDTLAKIMSPAIKVAKDKNLPLFCGEYGVYPTIPEDIALRWYKDVCDIFNANNIAYCHWCYKGDFPVVGENSVPNRKLVSVLTAK